MNARHRKTLQAIYATPTRANIRFGDIESLLIAVGATIFEGSGSRVAFELHGARLNLHRPHPGKEAKRYQVEDVRTFLGQQGVTP